MWSDSTKENLSDAICLCVSLTENAPVQDCQFLHLLSSCICENLKKEQGGAIHDWRNGRNR